MNTDRRGLRERGQSASLNFTSLEILKTVIASCSLILPSRLPHREIYAEGLYALSQLTVQSFASFEDGKSSTIIDFWRNSAAFCVSLIKKFEVFAELASKAFFNEEIGAFAIMMLEMIKAVARLLQLSIDPERGITTDWSKNNDHNNQTSLTVKSYERHYELEFMNASNRIKTSRAFLGRLSSHPSPVFSSLSVREELAFVGRRSGLSLNYSQGIAHALQSFQQERIKTSSPSTSTDSEEKSNSGIMDSPAANSSYNNNNEDGLIHDSKDATYQYHPNSHSHQPQFIRYSPRMPIDNSHEQAADYERRQLTNLSDFNTPLKQSSFTIPSPSNTPIKHNLADDFEATTTSVSTSSTSSQLFSPRHELIAAEIMYIMRPPLYTSLIYHMAIQQREKQANENNYNLTLPFLSSSWIVARTTVEKEDVWRALALLLSFLMEVCSIQMSQHSLQRLRQQVRRRVYLQTKQELDQAENSNKPVVDGLLEAFNRSTEKLVANGVLSSSAFSVRQEHPFEAELRRRKMALFLYLLRSPLFDRSTLPAVALLMRWTSEVPLVGSIPRYLKEVLCYMNKTYFYHSNS